MITQKELKELLEYNPETGIFVWRVRTSNRVEAGSEAGSDNGRGYIKIMINGKRYFAHRLAWLYEYGYFPENQVDHINGIKADNRLRNLREVSRQCNLQNQRMYTNNTSGIPGVSWDKRGKRWRAQIKIPGKQVHLGIFKDKRDAAVARYQYEQSSPDWHCDARNSTIKAIEREFGSEFANTLGERE